MVSSRTEIVIAVSDAARGAPIDKLSVVLVAVFGALFVEQFGKYAEPKSEVA